MKDTNVLIAIVFRLAQLRDAAENLASGIEALRVGLLRGPDALDEPALNAWLRILNSLAKRLEPPEGLLGKRPEPWRLRHTIERARDQARARATQPRGRTRSRRSGRQ